MLSEQWLLDNGLPRGPFDGQITLLARHRGRRLHLHDTCPMYRQMSLKRWPFTVTVALERLNVAEHLCHVCGPKLQWQLVNPAAPGGAQRKAYTAFASQLVQVRQGLPGPFTGTGLPHPDRLAALLSARAKLTGLASDAQGSTTADLSPLVPEIAATAQVVAAEIAAFRTAWDSPAGRLAASRIAVLANWRRQDQLMGGGFGSARRETPLQMRLPSGTTRADLAALGLTAHAHAAFQAWHAAVDAGKAPEECTTAALTHRPTADNVKLADHPLNRIAPQGAPRDGESLGAYARRQAADHLGGLLRDLVAHWDRSLEETVGEDWQQTCSFIGAPNSGVPLAIAPALATDGRIEWLAVPAAVLRLTGRRPVPDEHAHRLPPHVLADALRLVSEGMTPEQALAAVRGIHHDELTADVAR